MEEPFTFGVGWVVDVTVSPEEEGSGDEEREVHDDKDRVRHSVHRRETIPLVGPHPCTRERERESREGEKGGERKVCQNFAVK